MPTPIAWDRCPMCARWQFAPAPNVPPSAARPPAGRRTPAGLVTCRRHCPKYQFVLPWSGPGPLVPSSFFLGPSLQQWYDAGRPYDVFYVENKSLGDDSPYRLEEALGQGLTNLGTCIPDQGLYALDAELMQQMDDKLSAMQYGEAKKGTLRERIGLPGTLGETDLTTFDSTVLARRGVLSYAPAYPVFTDTTSSIRHVRVPFGTSIVYHQDTKEFEIPDDTRFYRTLLQKVTDVNGNPRYRKLETQLIVARADYDDGKGKSFATSLYGTYAWNDDETDAVLVTDPLRDGEPFRSRVVIYETDEPKATGVLDTKPRHVALALQDAHTIRHYAFPGGGACYDCHEELPFGLWQAKPECDFSRTPRVGWYSGNAPGWMGILAKQRGSPVSADSPVYTWTPGEAVSNMICNNCHGERGDSKGRQATILSEMTGGSARVTSFVDGLFLQSNRQLVFGSPPWTSGEGSSEDWAARYHTWMALGGTTQSIPASMLAIVGNTQVLGEMRPRIGSPPLDANMLSTAVDICSTFRYGSDLVRPTKGVTVDSLTPPNVFGAAAQQRSIVTNGDAELWLRVCSLDNPLGVVALGGIDTSKKGVFVHGYYPSEEYPPTAPVATHLHRLETGITPGNLMPWCFVKPTNPTDLKELDDWRAQPAYKLWDGNLAPYCPDALLASDRIDADGDWMETWPLRGAINAGMITYVYLDRLARKVVEPTPSYDHCELRGQ